MKRQISKFLSPLLLPVQELGPAVLRPTQLSWKDLGLTAVPCLLWMIATHARPYLISTICIQSTQSCLNQSVLSIDQLSLGIENSPADGFSYFTQNVSGTLAVLVPFCWTLLGRRPLRWAGIVSVWLADWAIALQVILWNGLFTEIAHLIAQRPRPFVYANPGLLGIDPAHYTSFYSGHTSSTAATSTVLVLILMSRRAPSLFVFFAFGLAEILVISTAYFRILAARHFLTDVLWGGFAGTLVAVVVFALHRKQAGECRFFTQNCSESTTT